MLGNAQTAATKVFDEFRKGQYKTVQGLGDFSKIDVSKRRQLEKIAVIGTSALENADADNFQNAQMRMERTYSTATVTIGDKPNQSLEPELYKILAESTDVNVLSEVWTKWRDATGPKMRDDYVTYFKMGNKAAKLNSVGDTKFNTFDDLWMFSWETNDLKQQVDQLMTELEPLYKKIHAYVRYHLTQKYGEGVMPADGTIPAHLLGNMWAQQWSNILNTITAINPHNDTEPIDAKVNDKLAKKVSLSMKFRLLDIINHHREMYLSCLIETRRHVPTLGSLLLRLGHEADDQDLLGPFHHREAKGPKSDLVSC